MPDRGLELQLYLLGPPEVRLSGQVLSFPTRKTLALLIYLAIERGHQPREYLAALLWPEATPQRSYASLRNTLGHLQNTLAKANPHGMYLSVTHQTLGLNPDAAISLDLHIIEKAYLSARQDRSGRALLEDAASLPLLQSAAACNRGNFLLGFSLGDAPSFNDWVDLQQERWYRRLGLILDRLSEIQFARGDFASTAETASQWIALEPLSEVAHRRKMRAHFAAGERGQALEAYEACRSVLAAELGVAPEPDTEVLVARIRAQATPQPLVLPEVQPDTPARFLERQFAGRRTEFNSLVDHFQLATQEQAQVTILLGEAGIGKTRLAREFLAWAAGQGAEILQGRAFESGTHLSYQPLVEAFRPLIDHVPELSYRAALSQLLPELRPEARLERSEFFESIAQLTLSVAKRAPLVLFLDDIQWADSATLDLLHYAMRRWRENRAPIHLLIGLRSEALRYTAGLQIPDLSMWLEQIRREVKPHYLELGPLDPDDTAKLVLSLLRTPDVDFADWLFHETRGHPFYLMETLKDLLERRALHPKRLPNEADRWVFEVDADHNLGEAVRVPSTVRAVLLARFHRLSPNAFAVLAAGAVLDQGITFRLLCAVSNLPEDAGLAALDELISRRLLHEAVQPGAASTYEFANDMIRDVIYTEAGDARRRLFHRRALEVMEAALASAAVLAHHALAAGLAEAALRYSLAAGNEALRLTALGEARAHLSKARQLAAELSPAGNSVDAAIRDSFMVLGQAYETDGRPDQAQAIYDELAGLP